MRVYSPRYTGTVTKYIFVETPEMTPSDLAIRAYEISRGVMIKETCFGLQLTGKEEDVDRLVAALRAIDPFHIFVKDRGFPPGDPRRCRANLGGARPGFFGHEFELGLLRFISRGLAALPSRRPDDVPRPPVPRRGEKLGASRLREIIESWGS